MNEQQIFQELKKQILIFYQKSYPYFQGDWKNFSSKDIRQLIELVEVELKEKVSEKWIYTHLKPETNEKLPRRDMLDIFSRFVGSGSWDEFVFNHYSSETNLTKRTESKFLENRSKPKFKKEYLLLLFIPILGFAFYEYGFKSVKKSIVIKNEFTQEPIQDKEIKVYQVDDNQKKKLEIVDSKIEIEPNQTKIVIKSPYFEQKEIDVTKIEAEIFVKPEDYALVLKSFMESDLKNWESRKEKLEKILSDDLEVIIFLKENLGAEHLNKKEFSEKLIIPTSGTKNLKIVELETNANKEITFIRIQKL